MVDSTFTYYDVHKLVNKIYIALLIDKSKLVLWLELDVLLEKRASLLLSVAFSILSKALKDHLNKDEGGKGEKAGDDEEDVIRRRRRRRRLRHQQPTYHPVGAAASF